MAADKAKELGIKPIAKMVSFSVAGCDATMMGLGPIYAVPKALKRAGKTIDDMDVIELNEAFAAQAIPCIKVLKMNPEQLLLQCVSAAVWAQQQYLNCCKIKINVESFRADIL